MIEIPRIAISLGDPGGVGAEVVIKALMQPAVRNVCCPVAVGNLELLRKTTVRLNAKLQFAGISSPSEVRNLPAGSATVPVLDSADLSRFEPAKISAANGRAAYGWICEAAKLALSGDVDAICTAPISKEAMFAAGFNFPGHTELLAELCGGCEVRMMLEGGGLHVVLQTIHVALCDVPPLLTRESIIHTIEITHRWATQFLGTDQPRIAVCGLNPHAGEGGHFGSEETEIIAPAIELARGKSINAAGPFPADTIFHRTLQGEFDVVIAMYHDQALIPVKTLDFHRGVNVTLGLPIIRTSPDHGTAFDIAGKGVANESSMVAAILRAAELAGKQSSGQ